VDAIAVAVSALIIAIVQATWKFRSAYQFRHLYRKVRLLTLLIKSKEVDRVVRVIRNGCYEWMDAKEVVVGDVIYIETGDLIYVDGVFVKGNNVKCDQAEITGDTEPTAKTPADICISLAGDIVTETILDPFIISGSQVTEGCGTYVVTTVGKFCYYQTILRGKLQLRRV
jgi:P-type Ca2+ transporter type 2C